ncbi:MAG: metallophosphoesterase [Thermoproteota archaeon]|nr:metallophosphoesterase [Candidatus Brockarchaeota archaeon]
MKIGVFADTHIGRNIPREVGELRRKAYRHAFTQAINIFVKEKVECVIHLGDLFEKRSMMSEDSVFVKEELQRLVNSIREEHGGEVSVFLIRGNHDGALDNNALDFVKHPLAKYLKVVGEAAIRGEEESYFFKGIRLIGLPYHPYISRVFKNVKNVIQRGLKMEGEIKILVIHNFIHGYHEVPPGVPPHNCLTVGDFDELGVDMVLAGHYHGKVNPMESNGTLFLTPGATEAVDLSDEGPFGVYVLDGRRVRFLPIKPLHEIRNVKVDSRDAVKPCEWFVEQSVREIDAYSSNLQARGVDGIMRIVLSGYTENDPHSIDMSLQKEIAKKTVSTGLLHVDLVNRVEDVKQRTVFSKLGSGLDYAMEILKSLGGISEEAMKIVEELSITLDEKASQRTGLLTDSDRSLFVKRWVQILEKAG